LLAQDLEAAFEVVDAIYRAVREHRVVEVGA